MKVCGRCKIKKEETCFWKAKNNNDGLQNYCKDCMLEKNTEYQRKRGVKERRKRQSVEELPPIKICNRCKIEKPISDFGIKTGKYIFPRSNCKKCESQLAHEYHLRHKNDEEYIRKNRERSKIYVNKNCDEIKKRRKIPEYAVKHAKHNLNSYYRNRDFINAKQAAKRQTPEYKAYMKSYRESRKEIIYQQELITKKRYHEKHRDNVTEKYAARLLEVQGQEVTSAAIKIKQAKVLINRALKKVEEIEVGKTKICIDCGKEKDFSQFWRENKLSEKRVAFCRECGSVRNEETKKRRIHGK